MQWIRFPWHINLRIVLKYEGKFHHIDSLLSQPLVATATSEQVVDYQALFADQDRVAMLMLACMTLELQKEMENRNAYATIKELTNMFQTQASQELYDTQRQLNACKMEKGQSVSSHVPKMKSYIDKLECLVHPLPHVLAVNTILGRSKGRKKAPPPLKNESIAKDAECFHCGKIGHWKSNFPSYLAELKCGKQTISSAKLGLFMIKLFAVSLNSWVFDTSCGIHICNNVKGMRSSKRLEKNAMVLHMGTKLKGVIFVSLLRDASFELAFKHYGSSVSKNNMFYFDAFPRNDIFKIHIDGVISIDKYVFHVAKRTKYDLNKTYLWHCRLGHINKQRIKKLQSDGILESTGSDSFNESEQCVCGKMTKNHFSSIGNRDEDLLVLIHTNVYGPFKVPKRDGDTYFVTFTDDFIENQLEKKIKILRSDLRGEYLSQKFLDHLAECGTVSQRTPPYTPRHNGGYALENAACILNMVPTKKVDKTSYEIWHGKAPRLFYLRETAGYYFYYPEENKVFVDCNRQFLKSDYLLQEFSGSDEVRDVSIQPQTKEPSPTPPENQENDVAPTAPTLRRSGTQSNPPDTYYGFMIDSEGRNLGDHDEPDTYNQVIHNCAKVVGCKWVFKIKTDMDVSTLVIRILFSIPEYYDYEIWQMDVKNAFLNGRLYEDGYMEQPEGVKAWLGICFAMKDLGWVPMIVKKYLSDAQSPTSYKEKRRIGKLLYASTIGSIMYVMTCMRPDVSYALSMTSRYQSDPKGEHWTAVKTILRYLRRTKDMFLVYGGLEDEVSVKGYTDASFQTDRDDTKSQSGYVFIMNVQAVAWRSFKQDTIAM
ncbi:retrotransposon protein, putative, ty1-copia subclass [Tanacetum coccineum]